MKKLLIEIISKIDRSNGEDTQSLLSELRNMAQSVLDHFYPEPKGRNE